MKIYYSDRTGVSKSIEVYRPQGKTVALDIVTGSSLDTAAANTYVWLKGSS